MAGALPFAMVPSIPSSLSLTPRLWQPAIYYCAYNVILLEYRKVPKTYVSIKVGKQKITQVSCDFS